MWRRLGVLDWIRIGLLALGVLFVATGLLPLREAAESMDDIGPLLVFLVGIIVLAELTKEAQVFDVIAARMAVLGRGNYVALFLLCTAFASFVTIFLNLDTTAVLLTPVMLALAPKARIAPLPLAMTTIWLANTASLLLPVSNLTNLLGMQKIGLNAQEFAARMWAPQIASIAVTMVFLWVFYWRRGQRRDLRYTPPLLEPVGDRVLFAASSAACVLFIVALLLKVDVGVAAPAAALIVVAAYAVRDRGRLRWSLIPWQLLIFVTGLFLVVPTLSRYGLADLMSLLLGDTPDPYRTAAVGGGLANAINNLPAYKAVEQVIPSGQQDQLLALLVGTNVAPVITPWASLATLLWFESCRRHDVPVPMRRFLGTGAGLAVVGLLVTVWALVTTS
ncbi:SLC13 family permease [Nonomuraea roseoviolacea]|uniref:Na+/H+ antiporter NhaD/arsenite permease-like protein n=1 Tax=Nonomuraea roseoviolacea subsp. carminata TaxID=160689 RepID=A0ABT1JRU4_9ACTN|nr:SLC13 family permease [Nonomuraea roseoviolacea]MCP2344157.1 Na+/H+ antiporter NhaD/arsenite permease-like protein [Nonomuraea roseoviolacea subsp. carminata]